MISSKPIFMGRLVFLSRTSFPERRMFASTLLIISCLLSCAEAGTLPNQTCRLGGKTFEAGDAWHPDVPPFGTMRCISCTCDTNGAVTCESQACPKLKCRKTLVRPTDCCPICARNAQEPTIDNTVSMPSSTEPPRESCIHDNKRYQHSQIFSTNKSGLRKTKENQCVLCICLDSDVLCHLKTCPNITCTDPYYAQEDCCPRCPGQRLIDYWEDGRDSSTVIEPSAANTSKSTDCVENGEVRYVDGATWHPMIGPFGAMRCVICACRNGQVQCRRMQCVPEEALPCQHPIRGDAQCCPSCPEANSTDVARVDAVQGSPCFTNHRKHDVFVAEVSAKRKVMLYIEDEERTVFNWVIEKKKVVHMEQLILTENEANNITAQLKETLANSQFGIAKQKNAAKLRRKLGKFVKKCHHEGCSRHQLQKVLKRFKMKTCSI
ncbi:hypothetical protein CAPTEDRAFT_224618 [Capitella teleta]|uniref:VWFC domain-containing protein n=1 Tax=Capitella teleta TaxID=283909 RepID=R7V6D5_CAPTE|nr:hypothetical protein CAPTEDRAFT_224618 [Capitella teleta]|eukprot:ELU14129.1 hypothetical protein CAPTEDRAFT_224618 [Capitella teleta]